MKKKLVISLLEDAKENATLDSASFSTTLCGAQGNYPKGEHEVTEFIKKRVRLHHETWIIGPIERALKELKR